MHKRWWTAMAGLVLILPLHAQEEIGPLVRTIKAVGREGAGNEQAAVAWRQLAARGPDTLPSILAALDDANDIAANWLRAGVDAIAEREVQAGHALPTAELESFIRQKRHAGAARRLAYEWLARVDPTAPGRLLPGMLHDPGAELRRDAVAVVLKEASGLFEKGERTRARELYRKALSGALDQDQVDVIARQLKTLDVEVDLAAHFGFLRQWWLVGPFDNAGGTGLHTVYPPEQAVSLAAHYMSKQGKEVHWIRHNTEDPYGRVDLNKALGKHMGAVAYCFTIIHSPVERSVQVRAGSDNALKIFLNGKPLFFRDEYHHGMRLDQHIAAGTLKAGRNELLIKVCQNEQKDDWAQSWLFQLRVSDAIGAAVPVTINSEWDGKGQR
jgi:hypothetical protein